MYLTQVIVENGEMRVENTRIFGISSDAEVLNDRVRMAIEYDNKPTAEMDAEILAIACQLYGTSPDGSWPEIIGDGS